MFASIGFTLIALLTCLCALAVWLRSAKVEAGPIPAQWPEAAATVETTSHSKSQFLANLSHEFRTPLAGMLGMADLLAATPLTAEQEAYVSAIRQSGTALASMIDDVLDFSKIEAGKLVILPEPFDPVLLVEGVAELLAPHAQSKGLEISTHIAGDVPSLVVGDAPRLRQILLNVAGNAVKFTRVGGVGIEVAIDARGLNFRVADTGDGVAPGRQSAIFEAFEQADNSTSKQYGGTGLGLSISRRIATAMGGSLELDATSQAGSTFCLRVPLQRTEDCPASTPLANHDWLAAIIVSPGPFQARYLSAQMGEMGIASLTAATADAATALLAKSPVPYLLIADCALGEHELASLSQACTAAGLAKPIVLFSPAERQILVSATGISYQHWLVKPVRQTSLRARIRGDNRSVSSATQLTTAAKPALGKRVLLAEDNEINALVATRQLERLGAHVVRAQDGPTALALARRANLGEMPLFDLILMDLRMPGMDGFEVTRAIRRFEACDLSKPLSIVALTASGLETDQSKWKLSGFDGYLRKPLNFSALERLVSPGQGSAVDPSHLLKKAS